uniref:Uncharacterized protein n=1 Tax=Cyprinus carpio TaxID=7962 RepID=A0A8C1ZVE3_CYPCA
TPPMSEALDEQRGSPPAQSKRCSLQIIRRSPSKFVSSLFSQHILIFYTVNFASNIIIYLVRHPDSKQFRPSVGRCQIPLENEIKSIFKKLFSRQDFFLSLQPNGLINGVQDNTSTYFYYLHIPKKLGQVAIRGRKKACFYDGMGLHDFIYDVEIFTPEVKLKEYIFSLYLILYAS